MSDAEEYLKHVTDRDRKAPPPEKSIAQQAREAERARQDQAAAQAIGRMK